MAPDMRLPDYDEVQVGDPLPVLGPCTADRTTLALFAGASGDHNPIHIDIEFARRAGLPDVFAQGMLGMAWLGRLLTGWVPQRALRRFDVRFVDLISVGNQITCTGKVVEKLVENNERCLRIEVRATNQLGEAKIIGDALIVAK
jgi:acyl dehydratase